MIQVRALRVALAIVAVFVSIACAMNVYGDDGAVRSEAEAVACPRGCAISTCHTGISRRLPPR